MRYLCLAYYDPKRFDAMSPDDMQALVSQCPAQDEKLRASGHLVMHGSLQVPGAAMAARPRAGRPLITDGPFAETKEQVGGFFIIEAADADEAKRVAALHPAALLGEAAGWGIEIRGIDFFEQFS
jgi:hypothetical protein